MAGLTKTLEISMVLNSLALTYVSAGAQKLPTEFYPVCGIKSIKGIPQIGIGTRDGQNQRKNSYPFDDQLMVVIEMDQKENKMSFDIQSVDNQPGWTPDLAGLSQAVSDINAWAAECGCCADSEALMEEIRDLLIEIRDDVEDIETIQGNALLVLRDIDLNTDGIEALLTAGNVNTAAAVTELEAQTTILNTHTGILSDILAEGIDQNTNLNDIKTLLTTSLGELQDINTNTAPLQAAINLVTAAINADSALIQTDLNAMQVQLASQITLLTTISGTLTGINAQFTGTVGITTANISGNVAYAVAASTYNAFELTVEVGTVTRGARVYSVGVYSIDAPLNKTLPALTFDASAATAYIDLMN